MSLTGRRTDINLNITRSVPTVFSHSRVGLSVLDVLKGSVTHLFAELNENKTFNLLLQSLNIQSGFPHGSIFGSADSVVEDLSLVACLDAELDRSWSYFMVFIDDAVCASVSDGELELPLDDALPVLLDVLVRRRALSERGGTV